MKKASEYLAAGVEAVCLVDCDARRVTVYRNEGPATIFDEGDLLTLPEIDSDFCVAVWHFFQDAEE